MTTLILESDFDDLNLNEVAETGYGIQAVAGATGLGLPPVTVQWLEGAGDGSRYRNKRVLGRDIDLPLDIVGRDRAHLRELIGRLARMMTGECTLALIEDDGSRWTTKVHRVGGGEYTLSGALDVQTTITLRAGDPYFTASAVTTQTVKGDAGTRSFLSDLVALPVAASQAIGTILLPNDGDVPAYPVWEVTGPGRDLHVVSANGEALRWNGTLAADEKLIIDCREATVVDGKGVNRYANLAPAPRFWVVPPGTSTARAELLDTTAASQISCSWRARRWMVI
ncbi:phage tail family protein [Kitasatospora sp. NPDC057940]|uniref:phage tail family protein n=1 Tax=Kitasatospora sp. NPDC057940 TaxID=3346285 RepID=UPI0036D8DDB1